MCYSILEFRICHVSSIFVSHAVLLPHMCLVHFLFLLLPASGFKFIAPKYKSTNHPTSTTTTRQVTYVYHDIPEEEETTRQKVSKTPPRRSINPLIINTLASVLGDILLKKRDDLNILVTSPIEVVQSASTLAVVSMEKWEKNSVVAGDDKILTPEERELVAGRLVGVCVRLPQLQQILVTTVTGSSWVRKYNEEHTFGVLKDEIGEGLDNSDPLFISLRVECCLALFILLVETPAFEKVNRTTFEVDFIDVDRLAVLQEGEAR